MTRFLFLAFGVGIAAATLPVTAELGLLTVAAFFPKRKPRRSSPSAKAVLSVIIPAHNEELLIARAVESVRASAGGVVRITAIAHNCSDQTATRAAEAGAEVLVYDDPAATGKGFALRHGFAHAFSQGADAALVIDADSTVSENLIDAVRRAFSGGAETVQCRYEMSSSGARAKAGLSALAVRGFNLIRPRGRDRLGLSAGILGNGFAISKIVWAHTPYRALSVVEDLEYHIHLVLAGKRVEFLDEARVSAELPASTLGENTQRSRWEGGRFRAARRWLWPLAKEILAGRLRLLEPLLDLAGLPLAYAAAILVFALALPLGWLRIYSIVALAAMALHVLAAAGAGDNFLRELRLLAVAPAYVFWKLRLLPRLLCVSSAHAAWIRTERTPQALAPGEAQGPATNLL